MNPEDIKLGDWSRMLFGEVPATFFIEVILRSAVLYLLLIISMRLMGKRMAAQLSRNERVATVSLAAAIGIPLQAPDKGLLPAFAIALIVILAGRMLSIWAFNHQPFEKASQGNVGMLIKDGVMDMQAMRRTRITQDRLFSALRGENIKQLGEVKRLYMEAAGAFSCVKEEHPGPGLSILPENDPEFMKLQSFTQEVTVCGRCGTRRVQSEPACGNCDYTGWTQAAV